MTKTKDGGFKLRHQLGSRVLLISKPAGRWMSLLLRGDGVTQEPEPFRGVPDQAIPKILIFESDETLRLFMADSSPELEKVRQFVRQARYYPFQLYALSLDEWLDVLEMFPPLDGLSQVPAVRAAASFHQAGETLVDGPINAAAELFHRLDSSGFKFGQLVRPCEQAWNWHQVMSWMQEALAVMSASVRDGSLRSLETFVTRPPTMQRGEKLPRLSKHGVGSDTREPNEYVFISLPGEPGRMSKFHTVNLKDPITGGRFEAGSEIGVEVVRLGSPTTSYYRLKSVFRPKEWVVRKHPIPLDVLSAA